MLATRCHFSGDGENFPLQFPVRLREARPTVAQLRLCLADNRLSREQEAVLVLDSVVPGSAQWCTLYSRSVGLHVRRERILFEREYT